MKLVWFHATGFWIGFACGTIGLFALALLRLLFPIITIVTVPFFWPSQFFAVLFSDGSPSIFVVIFLYLVTGTFYGVIGSEIQEWRRITHRPKTAVIA